MPYKTLNPATGELIRRYDDATDDEVRSAVTRSAAAFRSWRDTVLETRSAAMKKLAQLYREREAELAAIITEEMGKPISQARGEVRLVADIYDYYADNASGFMRGERIKASTGGDASVVLEPTGTVLGIMPWNYPFYQVARLAAPNLMLGNSILLKHAGNVPHAAAVQEELFHEAGFPTDVYINIFASSRQIADIVIPAPSVEGISLTGSERAGAAVAETAGRHLKKVVLELGGSDPFIVLDDENLKGTVQTAVRGRLGNSGQACTSAKRFIVLDDIYDAFLHRFTAEMAAVRPGDPTDGKTFLGPLATIQARDEVVSQVQAAVDAGAALKTGGSKLDRPGAWMEATVLADVTPEMSAYSEEIFGPVAVVHRARDIDEAVSIANDSPYGLGAAVFCADGELAASVAERIEAGMVFINENTDTAPDLPFGGIKRSGVGRELGRFGIEEFANRKLIHRPSTTE